MSVKRNVKGQSSSVSLPSFSTLSRAIWKLFSSVIPNTALAIKTMPKTSKNVLTSSTCSVPLQFILRQLHALSLWTCCCWIVNCPPYLLIPKSIHEGRSSLQYVNALLSQGCLDFEAYFRTLYISLKGFWVTGSLISTTVSHKKSRTKRTCTETNT